MSRLLLFLLFVNVVPSRARQVPPQNAVQNLQQFLNQVWLIVTPIEIWCGPSQLGTATGFFFENEGRLYLVTNRHVVRIEEKKFFPDKLRIRLHTNPQDHTQNSNYDIPLYRDKKSLWREKPGVDLVAIELPKDDMRRFTFISLSPAFLPPGNIVLGAGDDVLIVGYPYGFSDTLRNYPVVRNGSIASPYPVPFEGHPYFLVDARLHPGTSGSPVLVKPSNILKTMETTYLGDYHLIFLGVNSGSANFGADPSGLNSIWYANEVVEITAASFQPPAYPQPV